MAKRKRKISNRIRVNVTMELDCHKELAKLAAKKNCTIPELIRGFIDQGMTNNYCVDNIDLITDILNKQLKKLIDPAVNRIAALSSKACIQSATAAYLSAEAINKFVPVEERMDVKDAYEASRKKAIAYVKEKSND